MGVENRDTRRLGQALIGAIALTTVQLFHPDTIAAQEKPNAPIEITPTLVATPSGPITPFRSEHALIIAGLIGCGIVPAGIYYLLVKGLTDKR